MTRRNQSNLSEVSYFKENLLNFLKIYHPSRVGDDRFIHQRCEEAEDTFLIHVHNGINVTYALEAANKVLMQDLEFSIYQIIIDILCEKFFQIIDSKERKTVALSIIPECEKLYQAYNFNEYPVHSDSPDYENFLSEIYSLIQTHLNNGIQSKTTFM